MPQNKNAHVTDDLLLHYGQSFFGYGSWDADYWLIGFEERGCLDENPNEFNNRFDEWLDWNSNQPDLVDLKTYTDRCGIPPDWQNRTWNALYNMLPEDVRDQIRPLGPNNDFWGGAPKRGANYIALIEAMPFPAENMGEWPYEEWNIDFMRNRHACEEQFCKDALRIF